MNAGCELLGQCLIDEPLPRHPALAGKRRRYDGHGEMRLALRPRALMPRVTVRFILDLEPGRGEPFGQLAADGGGDGHAAQIIETIGDYKPSYSRGFSPWRNPAAARKVPRSSMTWWMWSPSEPAAAQSTGLRTQAVVIPMAAAGTRFFAMSSIISAVAGVTSWRRSSS